MRTKYIFFRHPDRLGNQNGNEGRRKSWEGTLLSLHCILTVNQSLRRVWRRRWWINVDVMSGTTFPLASSYGRKVKPQISMLTSFPRPRKKCYGQMSNGTSPFQRTKNSCLRIGSWRRWLLLFRRSRKIWTKIMLKRAHAGLWEKLQESTSLLGCIRAVQVVRG